jgi:hypothetical protein
LWTQGSTDTERSAGIAVMLGIVALVGEHGPDPGRDGESHQE